MLQVMLSNDSCYKTLVVDIKENVLSSAYPYCCKWHQLSLDGGQVGRVTL